MNWLILLYFIELGYSPFYQSTNIISEDYEFIKKENVYYVNFDAELLILDHLFIGGSTKTFMQHQSNSYHFLPIESDFLFKAGLKFDNLELGIRHQCNHPVLNYGVLTEKEAYGGYEEFYIRISSEL